MGVDLYCLAVLKLDNPESILGKANDRFYSAGPGHLYLEARNKFAGNGHDAETVVGHRRYLSEMHTVPHSYNNMFGFRRNTPKLRAQPSTVNSDDKRLFKRLRRALGSQFTEEELDEHYKRMYVVGYPFDDSAYISYHPSE